MNYEITTNHISELTSSNQDQKLCILSILSIVFIPAAYVFVAVVFFDNLINKNIKIKMNNKTYILVYAFISIGLISSEFKVISTIYAILMMLCLYSYQIFNYSIGIDNIKKLRILIFQVSFIIFLFGFLQYFNPIFIMPSKWVDISSYNLSKRIYSTFFNPNVFGFYINFIILLALEDLDIKKYNLNTLVFICGLACLILTFSRSSWISLILALSVVSLFNKKYIKYALLISLVIIISDTLLKTGRSNISKVVEDSSFLYRLEIWKTSIKIIKDHFINGIGFGTLNKYVAAYSDIVSTKIEHSHNLYIQIFVETGVLGFSIFIIFLMIILKKFKQRLLSKDNKIWITAFAVFAMTMIHSLVDSVALTPQIMMILSIYTGTLNSIKDH